MTLKDRFKKFKRTIRYYFLVWLINNIIKLPARKLPKLQRLLLKVFPLIFKKEIKKAERLLPEEFSENKNKILQGMIKNQVTTILEVFFYDKLKELNPDFVKIKGKEYLERAKKQYGSFIILTAHFGNWEIIGYELTSLGYPLHVVARPQAVNQMTQLINSFREKRGEKVIKGNNIIESLKLIKKKRVVGLLSDLNAREWGYQVKFFSRTASFYNAPVILAQRGKVPLIPAFAYREPDGSHIVEFEEPVDFKKSMTMPEKVRAYVERYENAFRRQPEQWCWFHERYQHADLGRSS
ncbi:MAG: lysophospholipid acyltransferase family protein [Candidatus Rifleibacteriota bacterium]